MQPVGGPAPAGGRLRARDRGAAVWEASRRSHQKIGDSVLQIALGSL